MFKWEKKTTKLFVFLDSDFVKTNKQKGKERSTISVK